MLKNLNQSNKKLHLIDLEFKLVEKLWITNIVHKVTDKRWILRFKMLKFICNREIKSNKIRLGKSFDRVAVDFVWKTPLMFANMGQISRRVMVAQFENIVRQKDTSLIDRIRKEELDAILYKSTLLYKKWEERVRNKSIWDVAPSYFIEKQEDLRGRFKCVPPFAEFLKNQKGWFKGGHIPLFLPYFLSNQKKEIQVK
ncbi:hypothetical protein DFJ73DRAFT_760288 [Zopfochytrium polystomum]|nr:hypothetical protein DFJ73DRAFT_760288 [Zopfochytrium polystomum]